MTMFCAQQTLVDRIRVALASDHPCEVTMFGDLSFLVNEKVVVSARNDDSLLVRLDADDHDRLLEVPGTRQTMMGSDRTIGPGWSALGEDTIDDELALDYRLEVALHCKRAADQLFGRSR